MFRSDTSLPKLTKARNKKKEAREQDPLLARIEHSIYSDFVDRKSHESGWLLNLMFYQGFHWMRTGNSISAYRSSDEPVRFKCNLIQGAVNHRVAKLTSNPPEWDVDVEVADGGVRDASKVAEKYLEYVWDKEEMEIRDKELATMFSVYGTAFLHPHWDPNAGEILDPKDFFTPDSQGVSPDIDDLLDAFDGDRDEALSWIEGRTELKTGDVRIELVSPFDLYIDERATCVERARWVIRTSEVSVDDLEVQFGSDIGIVPEGRNFGHGQLFKQLRSRFVNANVGFTGVSSEQVPDTVEVREYWERPTSLYPNGRYAVYAQNQLIHTGDNPYAHTHAEIPFIRFRDTIVPDRFWGSSTIEQAIPIQRAYNKVCSDIIKNSHDAGSNKWLVPVGSGLLPGALDRRSDEVVEYTPYGVAQGSPLRPERVHPGQVSSLQTVQLAEWKMAINDIFGVHDASKGNVPSGIKSGVAIQLLQEGDDTRLGSVLQEMRIGHAVLGRMVLDIARLYIDENEVRYFTSIAGEDAVSEVYEYTTNDLSVKSVRIRMGQMFNRKRAARQQSAMELLQYLPPEVIGSRPEIVENAMKAAGISVDKPGINEADEKRAKYNVKLLERGQMPQYQEYDNAEVHLSVVEGRMKRLDFDRLPQAVQGLFHQYRQMVLSAQMMAMQQQMMPPQPGGPPSPGPAGEPQGEGIGTPLSPNELAMPEDPQATQLPTDGL